MKIGNRNYDHIVINNIVINEDNSMTIKCRTHDLPEMTISVPSEIVINGFEEAIAIKERET